MADEGWLTAKRKTIIINAVFVGMVAGFGKMGEALLAGTEPTWALLLFVAGAMLGGFVGYLNSKQAEIETGKKATGSRKPGVQLGFR